MRELWATVSSLLSNRALWLPFFLVFGAAFFAGALVANAIILGSILTIAIFFLICRLPETVQRAILKYKPVRVGIDILVTAGASAMIASKMSGLNVYASVITFFVLFTITLESHACQIMGHSARPARA